MIIAEAAPQHVEFVTDPINGGPDVGERGRAALSHKGERESQPPNRKRLPMLEWFAMGKKNAPMKIIGAFCFGNNWRRQLAGQYFTAFQFTTFQNAAR